MTLKPGKESPPHKDPAEVVWVILKGTGRVTVDGNVAQVGPNTTISMPTGSSRQLINTGSDELVMLTIRGLVPSQQSSPSGKNPGL